MFQNNFYIWRVTWSGDVSVLSGMAEFTKKSGAGNM